LKVIHIVLAIALLAPCEAFAKWKLFPIPHKTKSESSSPKPKQETSSSKAKQEAPPPEPEKESASTPAPTAAPSPAVEDVEGPTAFVQLQAGGYSKSVVSSVDVNLGYNFTQHFGADIGLPIFYVRSPLSLVTNSDWKTTTLIGDPYIDVHYKVTGMGASFTSVLTGTIPASSPERVYTTGRAGVDWFNHIEPAKSIGGFIPFLNVGVANSTINRYYMPRPYSIGRPYQVLGLMADGEVGGSFKLPLGFRLGASAYGLLPSGSQKVFSRLVTPGATVVGPFSDNRYYFSAFETTGPASIDRDDGYSGWLEYNKIPKLSFQLGFTHSVHYHYNMITLSLNYDGTALIRTITGKNGQ
jgi:hypothetical protein